MSDTIGPCLPPHLQKKEEDRDDDSERGEAGAQTIGPALPTWLKDKGEPSQESSGPIGPSLPVTVGNTMVGTDDVGIGPALPPWMKTGSTNEEDGDDSFGPALPPGPRKSATIGPMIPSSTGVAEDNDPIIGPLPPSASDGKALSVAEEIEKRSKKMKDRLLGNEEPEKLEREEWMTELPPLLQGFATGPRKFRTREKHEIGDRSVWTDTPADREKRLRAQKEAQSAISDDDKVNREAWEKRDSEIAKRLSDNSETNRKESLMDMHERERKRKAQEAEDSGEAKIRRPFDRELDLQTNVFDEAAKKRMLKKTQGLSSRFSSAATTTKFL